MTWSYERLGTVRDVLRRAADLSARTLVVDVEPLVATWDSGQRQLDSGVIRMAGQLSGIAGVEVVCFTTNSARYPSEIPTSASARVTYVASARKPLRTAPYQDLPRPGVVIGDQVVTDGMLARRLGFAFLHYCPDPSGAPLGPRLLHYCGRLVRPFL